MVEGKWRPPVDRVLGKKCVFVKNIWLLTAVLGQKDHFEQALDSLYQTKGPLPAAALPTMLEGQPKRTASGLIGPSDGKEANKKATSEPLGIWASPKDMVAMGMVLRLCWSGRTLNVQQLGHRRERAVLLFSH